MMFAGLKQLCDTVIREAEMQAMKAIDDNLGTMADMNREQLLFGINSEGNRVGEYASPVYSALKKSRGSRAPFGVPDLLLEGNFHPSIFAKRNGDDIVFGAADWKYEKLSSPQFYGTEILGLTDQNKSEVTTGYIFPLIADWLTSQIRQTL